MEVNHDLVPLDPSDWLAVDDVPLLRVLLLVPIQQDLSAQLPLFPHALDLAVPLDRRWHIFAPRVLSRVVVRPVQHRIDRGIPIVELVPYDKRSGTG